MIAGAERGCLVLLLVYLVWIPLPFASVTGAAYVPLVAPPLILAAVAALLRARSAEPLAPSSPYRWWSAGLIAAASIGAMQLVPLPAGMLSIVSPESARLWHGAGRIASIFGNAEMPRAFPISVNPGATWSELFRILALLALFQAAALLVRSAPRRVAFAGTLAASALFQMLYGVREAALQRYAIWGWVNRRVFNRVTGTFVNPNHFAHYVALALPFAIFLCAIAWHASGAREKSFGRRVAQLLERRAVLFGTGALLAVACIAAILLAQSRGALLAAVTGCVAAAWIGIWRVRVTSSHAKERTRRPLSSVFITGVALTGVVAALAFWLGAERTIARFRPEAGQELTLVGRLTGVRSAVGVWRNFPIFGSGLGTFADISSMTQTAEPSFLFRHAHNDYAEILATAGAIGFVLTVGAFALGLLALARMIATAARSFRRRAFQIAAFASIAIAGVHALFDFNSFIPANAATLAAIAGAAAAFNAEEEQPSRARSSRGAEPGSA